jgi:hypothetical protein
MFLCVKLVATKIARQRGTAAGTEAAGKLDGLSGFCEQRRLGEAKRPQRAVGPSYRLTSDTRTYLAPELFPV